MKRDQIPVRTKRLLVMSAAAVGLTILPLAVSAPKLLLWNASASVPIGLYAVLPNASVHVGDLAVSRLPPDPERLAAYRGYLPASVPLIKPVSATAGTLICRYGEVITIAGRPIASAKSVDHLHRPMPVWDGCRRLDAHHIFLMNAAVPDSFDGRYFGPTPISLIRGRAIPLLAFRTSHP